jgi:hypothetical protein
VSAAAPAPTPVQESPSIKDALQQTRDEARMVLPGIQASFGFRLIAVSSALRCSSASLRSGSAKRPGRGACVRRGR